MINRAEHTYTDENMIKVFLSEVFLSLTPDSYYSNYTDVLDLYRKILQDLKYNYHNYWANKTYLYK